MIFYIGEPFKRTVTSNWVAAGPDDHLPCGPLECEAPRGGIGRHLFQILVDRDKGISNTQPEAAYAILQSWSFIAVWLAARGDSLANASLCVP